ncbi:MAG: hypothetical protein U9O98_07940 [Asgard group archaeon]|nr:hypothetical protein [Asgard group archaeon]
MNKKRKPRPEDYKKRQRIPPGPPPPRFSMYPGHMNHPFLRFRPYLGNHPFNYDILSHHFEEPLEDLETKDDALEFLEIRHKLLQKTRKEIEQMLKRLDSRESIINETQTKLQKMKEFEPEKLRKILQEGYRKYLKDWLDEEL